MRGGATKVPDLRDGARTKHVPADTIGAMQISEIRLHPIAIADAPLRSSYGRHAPYALRTIVELKTTDGITGVSETYGGDAPVAALEGAKSRIMGMDPFRLTGLWREFVSDARSIVA